MSHQERVRTFDEQSRAAARSFWLEMIAKRGQQLRNAEGGMGGVIEQALLCGATVEQMAAAMGMWPDEFKRRYAIREHTTKEHPE